MTRELKMILPLVIVVLILVCAYLEYQKNINMNNKKPETRPITSYKPTGGLIYNNELIKSLQNNLNIN